MTRIAMGILLGAAFFFGLLGAADGASMKTANEAYARGDWALATQLYEHIADEGVMHEDLYYNLGNAHFRIGNYGLAIFAYEQALRIASGHDDANYNLRLAREAVAARSTNQLREADGVPRWIRYSLYLSIEQSTVWLLVANALCFFVLGVRRFLPPGFRRRIASVSAGFLGAITVLLGLMLWGHVHVNQNIHHGVVVGDFVTMREGPNETLEERGQLHAGLRITVISSEPTWLLVRLGNGAQGWVRRSDVGLFR
tara:strand:- start:84311 stop:85075 length:765 start_codon:yes stop_codon:yes gene_type:complete